MAVGTNSVAAQAMHKAGAQRAATGENAVVVNCRSADIIVGPIGIVIADALLGEITPAWPRQCARAAPPGWLIPVNHCENYIVGVPDQPIGSLVAAAVQKVKASAPGKAAEIFYKQTGGCTKCCTALFSLFSAYYWCGAPSDR